MDININLRCHYIKDHEPLRMIRIPSLQASKEMVPMQTKDVHFYIHTPGDELKKWEELDPFTIIHTMGNIIFSSVDIPIAEQFEIGKDYNILILSI